MNKIFRVIWNHSTQTWQAVSELAKGQTKSESGQNVEHNQHSLLQKIFPFSLLSVALFGSMPLSALQITGTTVTAGSAGSVVITHDAKPSSVQNPNETLAIGSGLNVTGTNNIAIGNDIVVGGRGAFAIGLGADDANSLSKISVSGFSLEDRLNYLDKARTTFSPRGFRKLQSTAEGSLAVGAMVHALGGHSVAIGTASTASKDGSVSIGAFSIAKNTSTTALGTIATADGANSTAIGFNANATGTDSVAIGYNATAATASGSSRSISIGADSEATSSNAVALGAGAAAGGKNSMAFGQNAKTSGDNSLAFGTSANATSNEAIAIGFNSRANTTSLAIGNNATANIVGTGAIGHGAVSVGATKEGNANISGTVYSQISGSVVDASYSISFGNATRQRQLKNVAPGNISATSTDAINGSQLYNIIKPNQDKIAANTENITNLSKSVSALQTSLQSGASYSFKTAQKSGTAAAVDKATIGKDNRLIFSDGSFTTASVVGGTAATTKSDSTIKFDVVTQALSVGTDGKATAATGTAGLAKSTDVASAINSASFNLKANGAGNSKIKAGDTLNFVNGANVSITENGGAVTVGLDTQTQANLASAATAVQRIEIKAGGQAVKTLTKSANSLNFIGADNISVASENGDVKIAMSKTPTFDSVTVAAAPTNANHLTNKSYVDSAVAGKLASFKLGVNEETALGTVDSSNNTLRVKQGSGGLVSVTRSNNDITIDVAKGGVGDDFSVTKAGVVDAAQLSNTANKLKTLVETSVSTTTLAAGANGALTRPATDGAKLMNATEIAKAINAAGFTLKDNAADSGEQINPGDNVIITEGNNINVSRSAGTITVKTNDEVTFTKVNAQNVTTGGVSMTADGINAGNKQITGLASGGTVETNAANIKDVKDIVAAEAAWKIKNNANEAKKVGGENNVVNFVDSSTATASVTEATGTEKGYNVSFNVKEGSVTRAADGTVTKGNDGFITADTLAQQLGAANRALGEATFGIETETAGANGNKKVTGKVNNTLKLQGANSNIVTDVNAAGDAVTVGLSNTLTGLTSASFGSTNPVIVSANGINLNEKTITNSGSGIVNRDARDDKNVATIGNVKELSHWTIKANSENAFAAGQTGENAQRTTEANKVKGEHTLNFVGTNGVNVLLQEKPSGAGYDITMSLQTADAIPESREQLTPAEKAKLVTVDTLLQADQNLIDKGMKFKGDEGDAVSRKLGEELSIVGAATGDQATAKNIGVKRESDSSLGVYLKSNLTNLESATFGTSAENGVKVTASDIKIANDQAVLNGTSLAFKDSVTISATDKSITGLAERDVTAADYGIKDRAATEQAVKSVETLAKAAKTEVVGKKQAAVQAQATTGTNGQTIYEVSATKTTVALDNDSGLTLGGGVESDEGVINYTLGLNQATKTSLQTADSAVQNIVIQAGGTEVKTLSKTQNSINFVGDDNITVSKDGNNENVKIAISDTPTFTKVSTGELKAGSNVLNTTGLSVGDVAITASGINAGNKAITNVEKGTADDHAVNLAQLNEVKTKATTTVAAAASTPITVAEEANTDGSKKFVVGVNTLALSTAAGKLTAPAAADEGKLVNAAAIVAAVNEVGFRLNANEQTEAEATLIKAGDMLTVKQGKNLTVERTGGVITVKTNDDVTFNNVTASELKAGTNVLNSTGLTVGSVAITADGINAGNKVITNVQNGTADDHAVNLAQLNASAKAAKTEVEGTKQARVTKKADGANGQSIYEVSATKTTLTSNNDPALSISGAEDDNGLIAYTATINTTQINQTTNGKLNEVAVANQGKLVKAEDIVSAINTAGFNVQQNDEAKGQINAGDTVKFANGSGTIAKVETSGTTTTVKFDADTDVVTVGDNGAVTQLDATSEKLIKAKDVAVALAKTGFTLKTAAGADGEKDGNGADEVINTGEAVEIVAGKNLKVKQETNGKVTLSTLENVNFTNVTASELKAGTNVLNSTGLSIPTDNNNAVTITNAGIDAGGKNISDLANAYTKGDNTKNNYAATISDVKSIVADNAEWKIKNNDAAAASVGGEKNVVNFVNGTATTATVTEATGGYNVTFNVVESTLSKGTDNNYTASNTNGFVTGSNVAAKLNEVKQDLTNLGFDVSANKGDKQTHKLGNELNIVAATGAFTDNGKTFNGDNLKTKVSQDRDGKTTVEIGLNENIDVKKLDLKEGNNATTVNGSGLSTQTTDPNNAVTDKTTVNPDGVTVAGKDGVDGKSTLGKDGLTVSGADGKSLTTVGKDPNGGVVTVNGKDGVNAISLGADENGNGVIGLNGKDGTNANIQLIKGQAGLADNDFADPSKKTRLSYNTTVGGVAKTEELATLNDGIKMIGDSATGVERTLNKEFVLKGGEGAEANLTTEADKNIGVITDGANLSVRIAKSLTNLTSTNFTNGLSGDELRTSGLNATTLTFSNNTGAVTGIAGVLGTNSDITKVTLSEVQNHTAVAGRDLANLISNGLRVNANIGGQQTHKLGNEINIVAATEAFTDNGKTFNGDNLKTKVSQDRDGKTTVEIGLNENIDVKKLDLKDGNNATTVNGSGLTTAQLANPTDPTSKEKATTVNPDGVTVAGKDGVDGKSTLGKDGLTVSGVDGKSLTTVGKDPNGGVVTVNGKDGVNAISLGADAEGNGVIGLNGKDGTNANIQLIKGQAGLVENDFADPSQKTRLSYNTTVGGVAKTEELATLNDGIKMIGDSATGVERTLNKEFVLKGGEGAEANLTTEADKNIGVITDGANLSVRIAKSLTNLTSTNFTNGLSGDALRTAGLNATTLTFSNNTGAVTGIAGVLGTNSDITKVTLSEAQNHTAVAGRDLANLISNGLRVNANIGGQQTHKLGNEINIVAATEAFTDNGKTFNGDNLKTKVSQDRDGKTTVEIGLNENIDVKKLDLKDGNNATTVNGSGLTTAQLADPTDPTSKAKATTVNPDGVTVAGKDGVDGKSTLGKDGLTVSGKDGANGEGTTVSKDGLAVKGKDGKDGVNVTTNDKGGVITLTGRDGENATPSTDIQVAKGSKGLDGTNGDTRLTYTNGTNPDGTPKVETVASLNDGLAFSGDVATDKVNRKLNTELTIKGGVADATKLSDNNIGVMKDTAENANGLIVKLAKDLTALTSANFRDQAGNNATLNATSLAFTNNAGSVTGLESRTVATADYGTGTNANRAATEGAVLDVVTTGFNVSASVGAANTTANNVQKQELRKELSVVEAKEAFTVGTEVYNGDNLKTRITQDAAGKTTIEVGLKKDIKVEKLELEEKDADGNVVNSTKVNPTGVTTTGANGTSNFNQDGVTVAGKDGVDGKSVLGKDGLTVSGKDGANGEGTTVSKDGLTVKGKDGQDAVAAKATDNGSQITLKGKDGTNGITITATDGADGKSEIKFKDNNGVVDGLKGIVTAADAVNPITDVTRLQTPEQRTAYNNQAVSGKDLFNVIDNGLRVNANLGGQKTHALGNEINIVAAAAEFTDGTGADAKTFNGSNLKTKVSQDENGKTTVEIGLNKNIEVEKLDLKEGNNATTVNGSGLTTQTTDPNNGNAVTDKTTVNPDGVTVAGKDGVDGKSTLGKDGLTVSGKDGANGEGTTVSKDGLTVKGKDGQDAVAAKATDNGSQITLKGKDGTNGITITAADGADGKSEIKFKDNNGVVDGLKGIVTAADAVNPITDVTRLQTPEQRTAYNNQAVSGKDLFNVIDNGLRVNANLGGQKTHALGNEINIVAAAAEFTDGTGTDAKTFNGSNLKTKVSQDENGKTTVEIGLNKNIEVEKLDLKEGNNATTVNGSGLSTQTTDPTDNSVKDKTTVNPDGVTVAGKDGVDGKSTLGKDGLTVSGTGADGDKGAATMGKDGLTVKGKDGQDAVAAKATDNGSQITLKGKDGTNGITITATDGADGKSEIKFKDNNGVVDGLKGIVTVADAVNPITDVTRLQTPEQRTAYNNQAVSGKDLFNVIDNGLRLNANIGGQQTHKLGNEINIVAAAAEFTDGAGADAKTFNGSNLKTKVSQDENGKTTVEIGLNKNIEVEKLDLKEGNNATTVNGSGLTTAQLADPTDPTSKEKATTVNPDGVTVAGKDGVDGKSTLGKDGLTVSGTGAEGDKGESTVGKDGLTVKGKDGKDGVNVTTNDKGGVITLTGRDGENATPSTDIQVAKGSKGLDGTNGDTRLTYTNNGQVETVASLNDGLAFSGDDKNKVNRTLNTELTIKGGVSDTANLSDNNIGVVKDTSENANGLIVKLAKELTALTSANFRDQADNNATLNATSLAFTNNVGSVTGLEGRTVAATNYGKDANANRAATEGAVLDVVTTGFNVSASVGEANTTANNVQKQELRKELSVVEAQAPFTVDSEVYNGDNLKTRITQDAATGKTTIEVGLKKDLKVEKLELEEKDADGNVVNSTKVNPTGVTTTGANGTSNFSQDGVSVAGKDGVDGKSVLGKDGLTVSGTGAEGDKGSSTVGKDGLTVKGKDGQDAVAAKATEDGSQLVLKGKDGANGITITAADGADGKSAIEFKDGKGVVDGLRGMVGQPVVIDGKSTTITDLTQLKPADRTAYNNQAVSGKDLFNVIDNGLRLNADVGGKQTHALGNEIAVMALTATTAATNTAYSGENLQTFISQDKTTGKTTIEVGLKKDLKVEKLELVEKDAEGNVVNSTKVNPTGVTTTGANGTSSFGQDGVSVVGKDGVDGKSTLGKDGLTVAGKDGENGETTSVTKDGVAVAGKDGENTNVSKEGLVVTDKNGNRSVVGAEGLSVAGKDGTTAVGEKGVGVIGKDGITTLADNGLKVQGKEGNDAIDVQATEEGSQIILKGKDGKDGITLNVAGAGAEKTSILNFNDNNGVVDGLKGIVGTSVADITRLQTPEQRTAYNNQAVSGKDLFNVIDNGLRVNANLGGQKTHALGNEINIVAAAGEFTDGTGADAKTFNGKNLKTKISQENGVTTVEIGLNKNIEVEKLELKDGANSTTVNPTGITTTGANGTSSFGQDGVSVAGKDGVDGKSTLGKDGLTVAGKDGVNGETTNVTKDGLVVTNPQGNRSVVGAEGVTVAGKNGTTVVGESGVGVSGANGTTTLADNGLSVKGKDGQDAIDAKATADGSQITLKGKDGENGITITATDGENGKSEIAFNNNKGAINGLENRTVAANSDYGTGANVNRAATEGAVKAVDTRLTDVVNTGFNVAATVGEDNTDSNNSAKQSLAKTLSIVETDTTGFVVDGKTYVGNNLKTKVTQTAEGETKVEIGLNKNIEVEKLELKDGANSTTVNPTGITTSGANGTSTFGQDGVSVAGKDGVDGKSTLGKDGLTVAGKDGVNGETTNVTKDGLVVTNPQGNRSVVGAEGVTVAGKNGTTVVGESGVGVSGANGTTTLADNGLSVKGKDGQDGVNVTTNDKGGVISLTGRDGENATPSTDIQVAKGSKGLDGTNGDTRLTYTNNGQVETVASLNDGLAFSGDDENKVNRKLNTELTLKGGANVERVTEGNIAVVKDTTEGANGLNIKLAQDVKDLNSVAIGQDPANQAVITNNSFAMTATDPNDPTKSNTFRIENTANGAKLSGVANGDISPTSQDVVNGAQLYEVRNTITGGADLSTRPVQTVDGRTVDQVVVRDSAGKEYTLTTYNVHGQSEVVTNNVITAIHNMNEQGIKFFHTNDGTAKPKREADNTIDSSASGAYATAVGYQAKADGEQAVAIGNGSQALGNQTIAIGTGNVVSGNNSGAIGDPNTVAGNQSYAYGNNNTVAKGADNSFVVGNENNVQTEDTYVLGSRIKNTLANSVFLGNDSGYVAAGNTSAGNRAYTSSIINGLAYHYAGGKQEEVAGVVSVGNVDESGIQRTRRIQNVAPGLIGPQSTDAINGSQLYSVASNLSANIHNVNNRLTRVDRDLRSGIAGAVAIGSLVQAYNPSDSILAVGGGTYRGASALAIGYSKVSDNGRVIFKVNGSMNNAGHYMGGASIGFKF